MYNHIIIAQELIATLALSFSITILIVRYKRNGRLSQLLLALALTPLLLASFIDIFEYSNIINNADDFEDFITILFLPILIFSIHTSIFNKELKKRQQHEKIFKAIFNQTFSFIGLLNPKGELIEANQTALDFVRYDKDEPKGVPFANTRWWNHSKEEQEKVNKAIEEARQGRIARFETTHLDKDNQLHCIDISLKPLLDDNGELLFIIPEGRDISRMKQAQIELEEHQLKLEKTVDERTYELKSANKEISSINEELHKKNKELELINRQLTESKNNLEETLNQLRKTQQQLIDSEKMASLGILTAGVAHEINNPLNYILGAYTGLKHYINDYKIEDKNVHTLLNHIKTGVDKTAAIVSSLNQFNRTQEAYDEKCDIHSIIDNSLIMLNNRIKNHISINKDYSPDNISIYGNVGKMHQVFINIILNACQAIESKGLITIKTQRKDEDIVIDITDTGTGIKKEHLNKVIAPFFTTKAPGEGTGLGMSITYTIIQNHKGNIEITSNFGIGTNVRITLPHIRK